MILYIKNQKITDIKSIIIKKIKNIYVLNKIIYSIYLIKRIINEIKFVENILNSKAIKNLHDIHSMEKTVA